MSALDSVPPKKIVHWQMFVLVRMNCATTWIAQPVKGFKPFKGYAICGRQSGCIASAREIDFTAQTVWWCCACANCVVALRMRKLCGGTAHAQTVWWNCAFALVGGEHWPWTLYEYRALLFLPADVVASRSPFNTYRKTHKKSMYCFACFNQMTVI